MKDRLYVFDIDGTVADCSHRLHYITEDKKDYKSFYAEIVNDTPIKNVIDFMTDLFNSITFDDKFIFLTGRSDECRQQTTDWLKKHCCDIDSYEVLMRRKGDYREDTIIKKELLDKYLNINQNYEVAVIFEDRTSVVDMWRKEGYTCFQVAKGDY